MSGVVPVIFCPPKIIDLCALADSMFEVPPSIAESSEFAKELFECANEFLPYAPVNAPPE